MATQSSPKRGRKPLPPSERRRHPITCRLTDTEQALVDRRRGKMTRGEYLRRAALDRAPTLTTGHSEAAGDTPTINRQAWLELARLAANLNQYQHSVNAGYITAPTDVDLAAIRDLLDTVRRELQS